VLDYLHLESADGEDITEGQGNTVPLARIHQPFDMGAAVD